MPTTVHLSVPPSLQPAALAAAVERALAELEHASLDDVLARTRVLEHELRVLRDESNRVNLECQSERERVKDNQEKIKLNKQLPYLVGNVVELLDMAPEEEELEDQATTDVDAQRQGKAVVLKTTTRQTTAKSQTAVASVTQPLTQ